MIMVKNGDVVLNVNGKEYVLAVVNFNLEHHFDGNMKVGKYKGKVVLPDRFSKKLFDGWELVALKEFDRYYVAYEIDVRTIEKDDGLYEVLTVFDTNNGIIKDVIRINGNMKLNNMQDKKYFRT